MADVPSTLSQEETAVVLIEMALAKHNTRWDKTFFKAVLAGIMLSFSGLLAIIISGGSAGIAASNPGLVMVMEGLVFPVGLVMILLQGLELLTGSFMIFPMAAIKGAIPWWGVPLNWLIVTFGNLVGTLFFAAILAKCDGVATGQPYLDYIRSLAITKAVDPAWYQIFIRGIGCNWLVCVGYWQATAAKETFSKVIATWIPIWVFASCGFDHVIANMFSLGLSIMLGADLTPAHYIGKSLIPSFLGNLVGGLFVGLPAVYFYHCDWRAGELRGAEEGQTEQNSVTTTITSVVQKMSNDFPQPRPNKL